MEKILTNRDMIETLVEECYASMMMSEEHKLKEDEMQYVEELISYCYKAMKEGDAWLDQTIA
jgi:hypothetical protein